MGKNYFLILFLFFVSCNRIEKNIPPQTSDENNVDWIETLNKRVNVNSLNIYDPDKFLQEIIKDTVRLFQYKEINEQKNNTKALSYALNMLGKNKLNCSNYLMAIQYHKQAYELALTANDNYLEALSLNMMGVVYRRKSAVKTALEYYTRALRTAEESNNNADYMLKSIAISNEGIGGLYRLLGQYEQAIIYYKHSLQYEEKLGSTLGMAIDNHNIGKSYYLLGQYDSAITYHKKSLEYDIQRNSVYGKAICYNSLGEIFMKQNKLDSAYKLLIPAYKMSLKCGDSTYIVNSNLNLGQYHLASKNLDSSNFYIGKALEISKRIDYKDALRKGYELLSELTQLSENYPESLRYFKISNAYNDSIINEKTQQYLVDLTVLYDIEKKKNEIELLQKTNETNKQKLIARNRLILSLILAVFVIIVIAYIFRQRGMQKLNSMESELQKYLLQIKDSKRNKTPERDIKKLAVKNNLSEREAEVLYFINEGMSNADIAEKIFVSTNTIKYHIKNIYLKLDVKNRVEALNKIKQ